MSWLRSPVGLLVGREIRERTRTTAYRVTTVLLVLGAALAVAVPALIDSDDGDRPEVRVAVGADVPEATVADIEELRLSDGDQPIRLRVRSATATSTDVVAGGDVDLLVEPTRLVVGRDEPGTAEAITIAAVAELVRLHNAFDAAGISDEVAETVMTSPPPDLIRVAVHGDDGAVDDGRFVLAYVGSILLYMLLVFYGQMVAGGVNEEKSSRVVELLLTTVSPRQLLTAKVTGIGVVCLLQAAATVLAAGGAALATGVDLPDGSAAAVLGYLVWFALGYALYCTLFAAAGALTTRPEDAQQAATPLHVMLGIGYFVVISAATEPDSLVMVIASFVPFTAPLAMPVRASLGTVAPFEIAIAMALCLATTLVGLRVAARVYGGALLRFGERVRLRQALRRP